MELALGCGAAVAEVALKLAKGSNVLPLAGVDEPKGSLAADGVDWADVVVPPEDSPRRSSNGSLTVGVGALAAATD